MFYRSWELSLVTLIIIPATLLFIHIFGLRNKKAVSDRQISFSELSTLVIETITGIRVVKAFGMEDYEKERINKASEELYSNHMRSIIIDSYSTPVIQVIGASAGATIVVYGGYLIIHGIITPGDFTSFILSFFMLNDPVAKMNGFNLKLQEGLAAIKRIFEIMDTEPDIVSKPDAKPFKSFEKSIELNVRAFHYPEQPEATLEDIQIKVKKGEAVALVGSSGAGKTTLANLIPRFFDVTRGEVLIDGVNVKDYDLQAMRSQIAIVTQDTILFNDSVANNIIYGQPDCSKERMYAAARAANAHEFVSQLTDGYDTLIGEKASNSQAVRDSVSRLPVPWSRTLPSSSLMRPPPPWIPNQKSKSSRPSKT